MGKPIQLKDPVSKDHLYPITKPEFVRDEDGNNVMDLYPVKEGNVTTSAYTKGGSNETKNYNEFACGRYNQSTKSTNNQLNGTLFSVGVGMNSEDRKNAIEVTQKGDVYLLVGDVSCKLEPITGEEIENLFND